jgi:hypothetical protein
MKKRRIVIISFVLAAVLAVGVGFATVADTLFINGNFNFRNAQEILGNKDAAIKFTKNVETIPPQTATDGAVSITASAADDIATLKVAINGVTTADGATSVTPYVATATFEVVYETTDTSLDPVNLTVTKDGNALTIPGLEIDVNPSKTTLKVGETMTVTVTVTYTPTVDANNSGTEITDVFDIKLVYDDGTTAINN